MQRILLISHEVSRTGAPMVVLHFARWLRREHPAVGIDVLAVKGGALADEFRAVADRYTEWTVPMPASRSILMRIVRKVMRSLGLNREPSAAEAKDSMLVEIAGRNYDVVLANSLASIPVGVRVKSLSLVAPVLIAFVHELAMVTRQVLPDLAAHAQHVDRFWAASQLVQQVLVEQCGISKDHIDVQYECARLQDMSNGSLLGPDPVILHVGGAGSVVLRKGYDLFIQVARWVKVNHPELKVCFTWVGKVSAYDQPLIEHDLEHAGLKEMVEFIGERSDPAPIYGSFDVFLLPSREDPFPLVCIEVGAMGKPIVCFEGATGTAEVLRQGGGMIVPYLDVEAMGRAVVDYARDPERRAKDGELNRVQFANFGPDQQCPLMWQRITAAWEASKP